MRHAHVASTLTRADAAAPFRTPPPDNDPLPRVTRAAIVIEEHHTAEGRIVTWRETARRAAR